MGKQLDWVPVSAALLATGALALSSGSLLTPGGLTSAATPDVVRHHDARWLVVAIIYLAAAVALTLGLPSVLFLLGSGRGRVLGGVGGLVLAVGFVGTAGYAMLLVFFRALVRTDSLRQPGVDLVTHERGLAAFLYGWIAAVYVGELLLALALLRARATPRWVPLLLAAHVASLALLPVLPDRAARATTLLMALGFAGVAISAAGRSATPPG